MVQNRFTCLTCLSRDSAVLHSQVKVCSRADTRGSEGDVKERTRTVFNETVVKSVVANRRIADDCCYSIPRDISRVQQWKVFPLDQKDASLLHRG